MWVARTTTHTASRCALALLLALAGAARSAFAEPAPASAIQSIEITGNRITDEGFVRSNIALKPGEPATAAAMDQSIKKLFATGLFSDVRIDHAGNGLIRVSVVENRRVGSISFDGNNSIESSKLTSAITLKRGDIYTRTKGT